jgi:cysteine desulfurase/selenocysteine lyase
MTHAAAAFDVNRIREDFPILSTMVRGAPLVFLDSGASAQKPRQVIAAMTRFLETSYANVHRGAYRLSEAATEAFENARCAVARFLNAASPREVVFTGNATAAFNLLAHAFGPSCKAVVVSAMEHHANLVPWQMLRDRAGVELRICRVTDAGELDLDHLASLLADGRVGLVSVTHMSNVLGTVTPAERIVAMAHAAGARVAFDGSQAAVHRRVDVQALGCDFYVFTGHKLYGPTGIGVLYGRRDALDAMPPFLGGGDMIAEVTLEGFVPASVPARFEAGTPPITEAVGLHAAIDYVTAIGMGAIEAHERRLTDLAMARLSALPGIRVLGAAQDRGGVFAVAVDTAHAHDVATVLDRRGIAVRSGRHCAEPLHARFGVDSTCRASFGLYTTDAEVDAFANALAEAREFFR